jgi:hypothetical protein
MTQCMRARDPGFGTHARAGRPTLNTTTCGEVTGDSGCRYPGKAIKSTGFIACLKFVQTG